MYESGARREAFGRVAINGRTNAALNPLAVMRDPLTMDDYLAARMIRHRVGGLNDLDAWEMLG